MSGFLAPGQRLVNNLSLAQKILLIGGICGVPILVLLFAYVTTQWELMTFSQKERVGVKAIHPMVAVMRIVQIHRGLTVAMLNGDASAVTKLEEARTKGSAAFAKVNDELTQEHDALNLKSAWSEVEAGWAELKTAKESPKEAFARHVRLIEKIQGAIVTASDNSNLTLDPDLDSYYLIDAFVNRLPGLTEVLGTSRAKASGLAAKQQALPEERVDLVARLRIADELIRGVNRGLGRAFEANPHLKVVLGPDFDKAKTMVPEFNGLVRKEIIDAEMITVPAPKVFGAATETIDAVFALHEKATQELDRLLDLRIQKMRTSLTVMGLGLGAVLCLTLYFFFAIRSAVLVSAHELALGAQRLARGDLSQDVRCESNDEFGHIAQAFNHMQHSLVRLVGDLNAVVSEGQKGHFDRRMDVANAEGFGKDIGHALNTLLQTTQVALGEIQGISESLAAGDLSRTITQFYPGMFGHTVGAINQTVTVLQGVMNEVRVVVNAAAEGDFSKTIEVSGKQGYAKTLSELLNRLGKTAQDGLGDIARVAGALAEGDLTQRIDKHYPGLFGQTANGINLTVENLKGLLSEVVVAVDTINTAAQEIAAGNTNLSQRTESQASSLEETAASMEQLTSMVQQNTGHAQQANTLARESSDIATRGGGVVKASVQTMEDIATSSRKISDIISVIDGIAFQTNILALNAAVEAARAGEQGRGFAVVASEVRNLALRAAGAAKEIKDLITESVDKVERGTAQAEEAGQTMDQIVSSIQKVTTIMADITSASAEQSGGIQQVNQAIMAMDQNTQQNAALVEEATAAARSLEDQAHQLQSVVRRFKLDQRSQFGMTATPVRAATVALAPTAMAGEDDWGEF